METFLHTLLPQLLPESCTFEIHAFAGKTDLLGSWSNGSGLIGGGCSPIGALSSWWIVTTTTATTSRHASRSWP